MRSGGLSATHLSPKLVSFFLSSIQSQLAVDLLLLFSGLVLDISVDREIDRLVRFILYEWCGQMPAAPRASTTSPAVPAALPSFVVRATCGGPMLVLRSASSASCRSRTPRVCAKASASASCQG